MLAAVFGRALRSDWLFTEAGIFVGSLPGARTQRRKFDSRLISTEVLSAAMRWYNEKRMLAAWAVTRRGRGPAP